MRNLHEFGLYDNCRAMLKLSLLLLLKLFLFLFSFLILFILEMPIMVFAKCVIWYSDYSYPDTH